MTSEVMIPSTRMNQRPGMDHPLYYRKSPIATTTAGQHVRRLRRQAGLSQLDLALMAGVSQRHLSCVETGRANASPGTLHALLSALGAPLDHCNEVFLAAGYAPRYAATPLQSPALDVVHAAIEHILQANNPAPAIVLDNNWDITAANVSSGLLLTWRAWRRMRLQGSTCWTRCSVLEGWVNVWQMPRRFGLLPGNALPGRRLANRPWQSV